jgi:hypothetical protein
VPGQDDKGVRGQTHKPAVDHGKLFHAEAGAEYASSAVLHTAWDQLQASQALSLLPAVLVQLFVANPHTHAVSISAF